MKMLVMDTSTLVLGVSVIEDGKILGDYHTNLHKNHSIRLMPAINHLLEELEISPTELDAIGVAVGPGSYTGIRIGVTTAKTLAYTLDIPLYIESTLNVMAMNAFRYPGVIVPLIDARRERVYTGAFQVKEGRLEEVFKQRVVPLREWLEQLRELPGPFLFIGDDLEKFRETIQKTLKEKAQFGHPAENIPQATKLGVLVMQRWERGEAGTALSFTPNYLQITEAEAKWRAKQEKGVTK